MSDFFLGELRIFPYSKIPSGWAACDGSLLQIKANAALFSLIGKTYGGDGVTTFGLPDLRGRTPVAFGQLPSQSLTLLVGANGGTETVPLTQAQTPPHVHQVAAVSTAGTQIYPAGNYIAAVGNPAPLSTRAYYGVPGTLVAQAASTVSVTGASVGHNNMQPFLALSICIALTGFFPPRP